MTVVEEVELLEVEIDDREKRAKRFVDAIEFWKFDPQFKNFSISYKRLKVCDMILRTKTKRGTVGIELKRGEDFIASIIDGRFPNQVIVMKQQEGLDNIIFIFIGNIEEVFSKRNIKQAAYYGATASLSIKYGCSILSVPDDSSAVLQAFYCFKHSNLEPEISPYIKAKISGQEYQKAAYTCIPGINRKLANELGKHFIFGKLAYICYTEPKKAIKMLKSIKGIADGKANIIFKFMTDPDFDVK